MKRAFGHGTASFSGLAFPHEPDVLVKYGVSVKLVEDSKPPLYLINSRVPSYVHLTCLLQQGVIQSVEGTQPNGKLSKLAFCENFSDIPGHIDNLFLVE